MGKLELQCFNRSLTIYIYIYIYICVCVCVYIINIYISKENQLLAQFDSIGEATAIIHQLSSLLVLAPFWGRERERERERERTQTFLCSEYFS